MATKRKSRRTPRESRSARPRSAPRKQSRSRSTLPPPLTVRQELLLLAREGADTLRQAFLALLVIAVAAGVAFGVWSLRPTPSYSSQALKTGSPFNLTFRVENKNPWFALSNLSLVCVLDHVRASGLPPASVEANDVRFPGGKAQSLEPGDSATFTCPFRALIGHPINDDPDIVQRSEIYFHSEYDLPLPGSLRLIDNSARFFFNTHVLPPRWTSNP